MKKLIFHCTEVLLRLEFSKQEKRNGNRRLHQDHRRDQGVRESFHESLFSAKVKQKNHLSLPFLEDHGILAANSRIRFPSLPRVSAYRGELNCVLRDHKRVSARTESALTLLRVKMNRNVWTLLMLLCLASIFEANAARRLLRRESLEDHSDSAEPKSEGADINPVRLPRRFRGNSPTQRLHIKDQHNFDGKVEKININSEEDFPGIRAYGMQKKILKNNGHIERMQAEAEGKSGLDSRVARAIEAYGKSKEHLESNGEIQRVLRPTAMHQVPRGPGPRLVRSIESIEKQEGNEEGKKNTEDLEAQDAKVFRPLFVYRQQIAKRQQRGRNQIHGYQASQKPCQDRRPVY
ncbi:uncharacterized protein LOC143188386 [Calliopsis andreniformis]|uniref:uncharacterized protein LOC143188386 n=1 Tax=Calliopsis andreniformis TaxID=337506 RepID=UPI003FCCB6A9